MKIAAQSDAFIEKYGLADGLARMKKIGYDTVTYAINERYDSPFTTQWTDKEIREKYEPIGEAFRKAGLRLVHVYEQNEIYNDLLKHTTEARKTMVINGMKAAAYLGAEAYFIKPATMNQTVVGDIKEYTKNLTVDFIQLLKPYEESLGVRLGFFNNFRRSSNVPYACNSEELLELCKEFNVVCAIDVANAYKAWMRPGEMLETLKEYTRAFLVTDAENTLKLPAIPMFGAARYEDFIPGLKGIGDHVYAVTVTTPVYKRYADFKDVPEVFDAVDELLYTATKVVADRANLA